MNFEDSIRKSFDPNSFEFDEAHWEGAKSLLDKEFARRALYRKVFWVATINVLIAALLYCGINYYNNEEVIHPNFASTAISNQIDRNGVSDQYTANAPSLVVPGHIDNEATKNGEGILNDGIADAGTVGSDKRVLPEHSSVNADRNPVVTEVEEVVIIAPEVSSTITRTIPKSTGSTGRSAVVIPDNNQPDILAVAQQVVAESLRAQNFKSNPYSPVSFLESNFPDNAIVYSSQTSNYSIDPTSTNVSDGRFSMAPQKASNFASTEVMLFPGGSGNSFNFVGFTLGVGRQIPFGKQFFYEVGLRGAARIGEFSPSVRSTQLSFDFGPRQNEYQLRPSAVYSLQTPIFAGIDMNKHQFAGGIIPSFLLGVRGTSEYRGGLLPWEINNGSAANANTLDRGWLDKSGFNNFALSYAVRYQYNISEGFQLGVSAQYRSRDWVGEDYGKFFDFDSMEYVYSPAEQRNMVQRNWIIALEMRYGF